MSMPKLLTVDEVAERLHAPRSSVLSWVYAGKLRSVKAGRRRLITEDAVMEYLGLAGGASTPANVIPLKVPTPSASRRAKRGTNLRSKMTP